MSAKTSIRDNYCAEKQYGLLPVEARVEQRSARPSPVSIVLDTNVFVADFQMSGTAFFMLLNQSGRAGHSIYVPEVVFDEVVNKFEEQLRKSKDTIEKELRSVARISGASFRTPLSTRKLNQLVGDFETDLYQTLIGFEVTLWAYPDTTHKDLVGRALSRTRPFSENGKGYRDSLIWETVKEITTDRDNQQVVLVSGNTTHFCDESGLIHPDLLKDLDSCGIECNVKVISKLELFVQEYVTPWLEKLDGIRDQLLQNNYPGLSLRSAVEDMVVEHLKDRLFTPDAMGLPGEYGQALLYDVMEIANVDVADVMRCDDKSIWVTAVCDVKCLVSFLINKAIYYALPPGESPHIWNPDYDTDHVAGAAEKLIQARFVFILNEGSPEIAHSSLSSAYAYRDGAGR